jgi:hypothetical protein
MCQRMKMTVKKVNVFFTNDRIYEDRNGEERETFIKPFAEGLKELKTRAERKENDTINEKTN